MGKRGARVRDGESDSLSKFAEGMRAFTELDSLTRRMPRPLEVDFGSGLYFLPRQAGIPSFLEMQCSKVVRV